MLMSGSRVLVALWGCVMIAGCRREVDTPPATSRGPEAVAVLNEPIDHLDSVAREPMVVEDPDGTLFVTGYSASVALLWGSADGGVTWSRRRARAPQRGRGPKHCSLC